MIVTRIPLRVSLFGGGSDRPEFYKLGYGEVLNFSINRYMFVIGRKQVEPISSKFLIKWAEINKANSIEDLDHPIFKAALSSFSFETPLEVITFSDVEANTGLGSSSAFAVGMSLLLSTYCEQRLTKSELAKLAAKIEIDKADRKIGKQDHYGCAYGGINVFKFNANETVESTPVILSQSNKEKVFNAFRLVYIGGGRDAAAILKRQVVESDKSLENIRSSMNLIDSGVDALLRGDVAELGLLLNEAWSYKQRFGSSVSSKKIDDVYQRGMAAGAIGGKLLGAGGGGYFLFVVPEEVADRFDQGMCDFLVSRISLDDVGARLTYYDEA